MSDRRVLQPGDRAAIYEADIYGEVQDVDFDLVVLRGDNGQVYRLPSVVVSWIPPVDDPVFEVGAAYRDADDPQAAERYFYLPDTTTDTPFLTVTQVGEDKFYRRYWRRDELPRRIERAP